MVRERRGSGGMYGLGALASSYEVTNTTRAVGDLVQREFESEMERRKAKYISKRRGELGKVAICI